MKLLPGSIRGRLLLGLVVVALGVNAALMSSSYRAARHEIDELFDAHLAQSARVLRELLAPTPYSDVSQLESLLDERWDAALDTVYADDDDPLGHRYESKIAFQRITPDGRVAARSESAPRSPFSDLDHGFIDVRVDGALWRVFALPGGDEEGGVVQVGQRLGIREELERRIAIKTVQKSLYGLPLLVLLVWLVVGAGLRPLRRLTGEIRSRREGRLDPVSTLPGMTRELQPIVQALDSLFMRLRDAWDRERRFIDEAAHELRTPLAAIHLHAESLAETDDSDERRVRLQRLLSASARGTRLANQLLALARVESSDAAFVLTPIALGPLLREEIALMTPLAERDRVELELTLASGLPKVRADADMLSLLMRNLMDNAIRHSPPAKRVTVAAWRDGDRVVVVVDDSGPGIPPGDRERLLERFATGESGGDGSGLGLAIAARIAERHGSRLELLDGPSGEGLRVRFRLRAA